MVVIWNGDMYSAFVWSVRVSRCDVCRSRPLTEYKTQAFTAVLEMLRWFAGDQIRNVAVSTQPRLLASRTLPHPVTTPTSPPLPPVHWWKLGDSQSNLRPEPHHDGRGSHSPYCVQEG